MAQRKAGGTAKNLTDSNPKYLGVKVFDGERVNAGAVLVRQRGTRILPGRNTRVGRDYTIYAVASGVVRYTSRRKTTFTGKQRRAPQVHVLPDGEEE